MMGNHEEDTVQDVRPFLVSEAGQRANALSESKVPEPELENRCEMVALCYCGVPDCPIAFGLCHCGCGEKTDVCVFNDPRRGWVKGTPKRNFRFHKAKGAKRSVEFCQNLSVARMGPLNPNWKGDDMTVRSGRQRAERCFKDIGPCVNCGKAKSERHHKDGDTLNNSPENIMILCRRCHMIEDGRLYKPTPPAQLQAMRAARLKSAHEQTHCKRGHLLSGTNLYLYRRSRGCKECRRGYYRDRNKVPAERWRVK